MGITLIKDMVSHKKAIFMLDHVPKRYLKLCARERGQLHFTLMLLHLSCFLESLRAAGGVAERDQGQELRDRKQAAGTRLLK